MEIKIRGWHTVQKKMFSAEEMATDQLALLPTGSFINVSGDDTRLSEIYPKDVFIPLLYTGLKDKNGNEGYHKDIVKRLDSLYTLEWHDNLAGWYLQPLGGGWHGLTKGDFAHMCEIVGSTFENPELVGSAI